MTNERALSRKGFVLVLLVNLEYLIQLEMCFQWEMFMDIYSLQVLKSVFLAI